MVDTRTITLPAIWAEDAQTSIPTPPVANTTYRNTSLDGDTIVEGWPYQKIVDSADFNQFLYLVTNLVKTCEQYGIMPWCSTTAYKQNGMCLGSDGVVYWAKQDNTGVNPINDAGMVTWGIFVDPGDNFVTETVLMNQINLCEKLANKTQTLSSSSTTTQYPSAKCVYDNINNLDNSKQDNITGGASTITSSNLTANRALISDGSGKVAVSAVTNTELGYLDGVTSGVQAQINSKQNSSNAVTTNTAQTITGSKTFTQQILRSASFSSSVSYFDTFTDSNGKGATTSEAFYNTNRIYKRGCAYSTTSDKTLYLDCVAADDGTGWIQSGGTSTNLSLSGVDSSTTSSIIPTRGWVNNPSTSTNVLHRTGNETASGNKTFSGQIIRSTAPSASDNSTQVPNTSWVNSRITSIMNSGTDIMPNYNTPTTVPFSAYTSSSNSWTCPITAFVSIYPAKSQAVYDHLWTLYIQPSGSSSWNIIAGGTGGAYTGFSGCQLFLNANDKLYITSNNTGIYNNLTIVYYPLK